MSEDAFKEALAERLRALMERRGWSLDRFAQERHIPKGSMEKYVRGMTAPGARALQSIRLGASADANWLLLGEVDQEEEAQIAAVHDAAFNSFREFVDMIRRRHHRPEHAEMLTTNLEVDGLREASRWAMKTADRFRISFNAKRARPDMGDSLGFAGDGEG